MPNLNINSLNSSQSIGWADALIARSAANRFIFGVAGPVLGTGGLLLQTADTLGWSDAPFVREAAGIIALRDSATARDGAIRIYNNNGTWDATTNYERGFMQWNGNIFEIGSRYAGTGVARAVRIVSYPNGVTIGWTNAAGDSDFQQVMNVYSGGVQCDGNVFTVGAARDLGYINLPWRDLFLRPSASLTPQANGDLVIEKTSNTLLTLKLKGSDATVRTFTPIRNALTTEDAGFANFVATADADAVSAISTLTTSGAVTHHIQVSINGTKAWIPCSTNAPT